MKPSKSLIEQNFLSANNIAELEEQIELGVDINCSDGIGRTKLFKAVMFSNLEIVKRLL